MEHKKPVVGVVLQFALAAVLYSVYALITVGDGAGGTLFPGVLLVYAPGLYLVNRAFLTRQRTMRGVVILNGAAAAVLMGAILLVDGVPAAAPLAVMAVFVAGVTVRAPKLALSEPGLHSLMLALDGTAVLLVLFVGVVAAIGAPPSIGLVIAAGFAACVMGVIVVRIGRKMGLREGLLIAAAFGALMLLVQGLVTWVAAPAGRGIVTLWNAFTYGVKLIASLLWGLLVYLASLIGTQEGGETAPYLPDRIVTDTRSVEEISPLAGVIFGVLGIVLLVLFVVWGIRKLSRLRVGGKAQAPAAEKRSRQRLPLKTALKTLWTGLLTRMRVRIFLFRSRNTPVGLYYGLVDRCRFSLWHKREGETPGEFLSRLSRLAAGDPALSAALADLIPKVNGALYGRQDCPSTVKEAGLIRRRMGAAMIRRFFSAAAGKLAKGRKTVDKKPNLC